MKNILGFVALLIFAFSSAALSHAAPTGQATGQARTPAARPAAAPAANIQNGKRLFASQGCNKCHGDDAQGMSGTPIAGPRIGPPPVAMAAFVMQVREPSGAMVPYGASQVSDAELADIYAFLQSLAPAGPASAAPAVAPGNADNGKRIYTAYGCYQCHGGEGQGSIQTGGARIGPPPIPVAEFIAYVRQPVNQMPPYTAKAVSDSEMADIYAFLQTRPTPPPAKNIPLLNQ